MENLAVLEEFHHLNLEEMLEAEIKVLWSQEGDWRLGGSVFSNLFLFFENFQK